LVGDTHGGVVLLKLSPNLTKSGPEKVVIDENKKKDDPRL